MIRITDEMIHGTVSRPFLKRIIYNFIKKKLLKKNYWIKELVKFDLIMQSAKMVNSFVDMLLMKTALPHLIQKPLVLSINILLSGWVKNKLLPMQKAFFIK